MLCRFQKTKKPAILTALLPLTFIVLYQGDLAYGNKLQRINSKYHELNIYFHHIINIS